LSVSKGDIHSLGFVEISEKEFRSDEQACEDLLDKVTEDYAGGVFSE